MSARIMCVAPTYNNEFFRWNSSTDGVISGGKHLQHEFRSSVQCIINSKHIVRVNSRKPREFNRFFVAIESVRAFFLSFFFFNYTRIIHHPHLIGQ